MSRLYSFTTRLKNLILPLIFFIAIPLSSQDNICEMIDEVIATLCIDTNNGTSSLVLSDNPLRTTQNLPSLFSSGDQIKLACEDGNESPDTVTFNFISSDMGRDSFSTNSLLDPTCTAYSITYPDGSRGEGFTGERIESRTKTTLDLTIFCPRNCLALSVLDDWGDRIGITEPDPDEDDEYYIGCQPVCRPLVTDFHILTCLDGPGNGPGREDVVLDGSIRCTRNLSRARLAGPGCTITIDTVTISHNSEEMRNGEDYGPFSLVGDIQFPIELNHGEELPFSIEFNPRDDGDFEAEVTICYSYGENCDCENGDVPLVANLNDEHCENSDAWYSFTIEGLGYNIDEGDEFNECPECEICMARAFDYLISGNNVSSAGCRDFIQDDYIVGIVGEGAPSNLINGSDCDLYLDISTGDLYGYRRDIMSSWVQVSYGSRFLGFDCGRFIPSLPTLFFNSESSTDEKAIYYVPGFGQLPREIDLMLTQDIACQLNQPGDIINVTPADLSMPARQDMHITFPFEMIACLNNTIFLSYIGEGSVDFDSEFSVCEAFVEFEGRNSYAFFDQSARDRTAALNGCDNSLSSECGYIASEFIVAAMTENGPEDICSFDPEQQEISERREQFCFGNIEFNPTLIGKTADTSLFLLQCIQPPDFASEPNFSQETSAVMEQPLTCADLGFPIPFLGDGCEITIDTAFIGGDQFFRNEEENTAFMTSFSGFPITLNSGDVQEVPLTYSPEETGFEFSTLVICYSNSCFIDTRDNRYEPLPEDHESQLCKDKTLIIPLSGTGVDISSVDENLDGDPEIEDPCSCGDPLNRTIDGTFFFHDFVSVSQVDNSSTVELEITAGEVYDENGDPIGRNMNGRITIPYDPGRMAFFIEFFTEDGVGYDGQAYLDGNLIVGSGDEIGGICSGPCQAIPTMDQWGIILLILMLSIFGVVWIRREDYSMSY